MNVEVPSKEVDSKSDIDRLDGSAANHPVHRRVAGEPGWTLCVPVGILPAMLMLSAREQGDPRVVVRCGEEEGPGELGSGEALVELELSPIDPIDRLMIAGSYPDAPAGSWTPGAEGCGRVIQVGTGGSVDEGSRVVLPLHRGAWRGRSMHSIAELCPLADAVPAEVAATLRINGLSAWVLLSETLGLDAGDWLLQAPGSGGLSRYVIQLARDRGVRTLNIVRDRSQFGELEALGADRVMTYEMLAATRRSELCDGAGIEVALDGVGGATTAALGRKLSPGGRVITYGGVSRNPPQLDVAELIFHGIALEGFWLRNWTRGRATAEIHQAMRAVAAANPQVKVEAVYPLSDHRQAFEHARTARGRVFFKPC